MGMEMFGEVIYSYTRAQAIADGVLIDVTEKGKEAGFKIPVAVTQNVWGEYITPSKTDAERWGQSTDGRLWDTLSMLMFAIRRGSSRSEIMYEVIFTMKGKQRTMQLKAIISGGDHGEPVLTIMLPHED